MKTFCIYARSIITNNHSITSGFSDMTEKLLLQ